MMENSKEILEGNAIIAEFDGWEKIGQHGYYQKTGTNYNIHVDNMQYHSSWDWLMPVWDKLTNVLRESMDTDRYFHQLNRFENKIHSNNIAGCFKIIVENIKWHKENVASQ